MTRDNNSTKRVNREVNKKRRKPPKEKKVPDKSLTGWKGWWIRMESEGRKMENTKGLIREEGIQKHQKVANG